MLILYYLVVVWHFSHEKLYKQSLSNLSPDPLHIKWGSEYQTSLVSYGEFGDMYECRNKS